MLEQKFIDKSWEEAKGQWTHVKLSPPRVFAKEEKENLGDVIACFDSQTKRTYVDESNLEKNVGLGNLRPILSHEIGHHKFCPYGIRNFVRLIGHAYKVTRNMKNAKLVENLFSDIIINTHIFNKGENGIIDVYRRFSQNNDSKMWQFYMKTYENMINLQNGIMNKPASEDMNKNAERIGDILSKSMYDANKWPGSIKEFAKAVKKYLTEDKKQKEEQGGQNGNGNSEGEQPNMQGQKSKNDNGDCKGDIGPKEYEYVNANGQRNQNGTPGNTGDQQKQGNQQGQGNQPEYKVPCIDEHNAKDFVPFDMGKTSDKELAKYVEKETKGLGKEIGAKDLGTVIAGLGLGTRKQANAWFYRDLVSSYFLELPELNAGVNSSIPRVPERWRTSDPPERLNLEYSIANFGVIIPNLTTYQFVSKKIYDSQNGRESPDLLIALDSSGSMPDPIGYLSFPVLSGMLAAHTALEHGKKVAVVNFSGGYDFVDFTNDSYKIDEMIVNYFGGGTVIPGDKIYELVSRNNYPTHVLIISDTEIANITGEIGYLESALKRGNGGGTIFLDCEPSDNTKLLVEIGFDVQFARGFEDMDDLTLKKTKELYNVT